MGEAGHDISWKLYVDTESVGISGADKKITITASNFGVPSPAAGTTYTSINGTTTYGELSYPNKLTHAPSYQMDIVPYVQKVRTSLSSYNTNNPSVYARTALGHYPVYMTHAQGNGGYTYESDIGLKGFNLSGGTVMFDSGIASTALKEKDASNTDQNYVKTAVLSTYKDSDGYYTFTLPNGAKSGTVTVSVGSDDDDTLASTLNNFNNDDGHGGYQVTGTIPLEGDASKYKNFYNRIPNGTNNNRLTDDLYFDVWDFNSQAAISANNSALDIMMKINPKNGLIGFAFANGMLNWSMPNTINSYETWASSHDFMVSTSLGFDSFGYSYGTAAGGDSDGTKADFYSFYSSVWGTSGDTRDSSKNRRIECIGETKNGTYTLNKTRIQNPSIVSLGVENKRSNVYLAFYDSTNGEIRFRAGQITSEVTDFGSFQDKYTDYNSGSGTKTYLSNVPFQILANQSGTNLLGKASEYLSIGVTSQNIVYFVWYDGKDLKISYNDDPIPETALTGTAMGAWKPAGTIMENAGKYCQLVVDAADNIHVAAYDSINGDLKYAYIPTTNGKASIATNGTISGLKVCTVDSYMTVGKELTIDVVKEGTKYIPHIGYFGNSPKKPRYAYLVDADSTPLDGVNSNDMYTGVWECGVVPSTSTITTDSKRRINVGLWKNSNGERVYSTYTRTNDAVSFEGKDYSKADTNVYKAHIAGNSDSNSNYRSSAAGETGTCYGNGSNYAVLGYGVQAANEPSRDFVETAQKR